MTTELWQKYLDLSLPLKIVIGALIGTIIGPGLVGFVSEYATYAYALRLGIRPPLEGIPYLRTSVTAGSLILTVSVGTIFILTRLGAEKLSSQLLRFAQDLSRNLNRIISLLNLIPKVNFPKIPINRALSSIKGLSVKSAISLTTIVSVSSGIIVYLISRYIDDPLYFQNSIVVSAYVFIALLTTWNTKSIWWIATLSGVLFYAISFVLLFNISLYAYFLRIVGYGGGSQVTVHFNEIGRDSLPCFLQLRTTEAIICLENNHETVTEVPIEKIYKVTYELNGVLVNYKLAGRNANNEINEGQG